MSLPSTTSTTNEKIIKEEKTIITKNIDESEKSQSTTQFQEESKEESNSKSSSTKSKQSKLSSKSSVASHSSITTDSSNGVGIYTIHHKSIQNITPSKSTSSSSSAATITALLNQPHPPNSWIETIQFKAQYCHFRSNDFVSVINSARSLDQVEGLGQQASSSHSSTPPKNTTTTTAEEAILIYNSRIKPGKSEEHFSTRTKQPCQLIKQEFLPPSSVSKQESTIIHHHPNPLFCFKFPRVRKLFGAKSLDDIINLDTKTKSSSSQVEQQQEPQQSRFIKQVRSQSASTSSEIHTRTSTTKDNNKQKIIASGSVSNIITNDDDDDDDVRRSHSHSHSTNKPGSSHSHVNKKPKRTQVSSASSIVTRVTGGGGDESCSTAANLGDKSKLKRSTSSSSSSDNGIGGFRTSTTQATINTSGNSNNKGQVVDENNSQNPKLKKDSQSQQQSDKSVVNNSKKLDTKNIPCCGKSIIKSPVDNLEESQEVTTSTKKKISFLKPINKVCPITTSSNDSLIGEENNMMEINNSNANYKPRLVKTSISYLQRPMSPFPKPSIIIPSSSSSSAQCPSSSSSHHNENIEPTLTRNDVAKCEEMKTAVGNEKNTAAKLVFFKEKDVSLLPAGDFQEKLISGNIKKDATQKYVQGSQDETNELYKHMKKFQASSSSSSSSSSAAQLKDTRYHKSLFETSNRVESSTSSLKSNKVLVVGVGRNATSTINDSSNKSETIMSTTAALNTNSSSPLCSSSTIGATVGIKSPSSQMNGHTVNNNGSPIVVKMSDLQSPTYVKKTVQMFNSILNSTNATNSNGTSSSSNGGRERIIPIVHHHNNNNNINGSNNGNRINHVKNGQLIFQQQGTSIEKNGTSSHSHNLSSTTIIKSIISNNNNNNVVETNGTSQSQSQYKSSPKIITHVISSPNSSDFSSSSSSSVSSSSTIIQTPSTTSVVEKNGHYFLQLMNAEKLKIEKLISDATEQLQGLELESNSEEEGRFGAAIGKARLLIGKKFKQFEGLCKTNLDEQSKGTLGEPFTTQNDDLAGFWDMVLIQVDQIHAMFKELDPKYQQEKVNEGGLPDSLYQRSSIVAAPRKDTVVTRKSSSTPTSKSTRTTNSTTRSKPSPSSSSSSTTPNSRDEMRRKMLADKRRAMMMKNAANGGNGASPSSPSSSTPDVQIFVPESQ